MLKLAAAVLALALAGVANADGWRSLRVDASSEAAFKQSVAVFREKLSPARQQVFAGALFDIWRQGTDEAKANESEYTVGDYHRQLHGLSYDEVVTFTDATGATAKARHRDAQRTQESGTPPPWQAPYGVSGEERGARAHRTLDTQAPVRVRTGKANNR